MKKYIDTGKTRTVKIKIAEYYCDTCGKKLDKDNKKKTWCRVGVGIRHGCSDNPECNPFY